MRILKKLLPLLVLLLWGTAAKAQYNPTDPPEPGVYFTLTTRIVPADGGYTYYGGGSYAFGSSVHLDVLPYSGYRFLDWEDEQGNIVSTERVFNYTMPPRDVTLTARFVYDPSSPEEPSTPEFKTISEITVISSPLDAGRFYDPIGGGSRYESYTREYEVGETYRFSAYPNSHYRFVNWTRNGIEITTDSSFDYTVPIGDHTLVANFVYDPDSPAEPGEPLPMYLLKVKSNPEGAAYVYFDGRYYAVQEDYLQQGSPNRIRANASTYYHFLNWTDQDGNVVSETPDFDWIMPARHTELTANYTYEYDPSSPDEPGTPNPDGSIGENMVMWPRFGMYDDTHVQILCETPGATIHYTLDGSTPTAESPVYTAPVYVDRNLVVRAICLKEGMENSPVVSYQVTAYKVAKPVFTFENRLLKISSDTPDAIIRYTLDFTDPNEESEVYTAPFEPEENCRIKAYATKEGLTDSPISIYVFRRAEHMIPAPTFSMNDEGRLVITPAASGGQTFYTLDGTVPTASSTLYTEPLLLDGNFTVKAFTTHPAYYDSPIGEYVIEGFKVETPTATYGNLALSLATSTSGATLRYTFDGTIPTEESEEYSSPLSLTEDCEVIARGFKPNYEPSDTVSYIFRLAEHKAIDPELSYNPETKKLTMSCATENAEIRYTVDGDIPTETTGNIYTGEISVVGNHTYMAKAFRSDLFPSEAVTVAVSDQKVAAPIITHSLETMKVTMSCPTVGAEIRYTTDRSVPTESTGTVYTGPIDIIGNLTFTARAFLANYVESDVTVYEVADMKLPTPTAAYGRHAVTLSCSEPGASILYTLDGTEPTSASARYESPLPMTGDCLVRFFASKTGYNDSDENSFRFTLSQWQDTVPTIYKDFRNRMIYVQHPDTVSIRVDIDGQERVLNHIDSIAVTPDMKLMAFTTIAANEDRYDSEAVTEEILFHQAPYIFFDGHEVRIFAMDPDSIANDATRHIFINGNHYEMLEDITFPIDYFGDVWAYVESDHTFRGGESGITIDYFNTGMTAGAQNGHRLEEAFKEWNTRPEDYENLTVVGRIQKEDLAFIGSLPLLADLTLDATGWQDDDCEGVFAGSPISTLRTGAIASGMLKGMPKLTSVVWTGETERVPEGVISEAGNPNVLLWVKDKALAPIDTENVVTMDSYGTGSAESISLQTGYPFNSCNDFFVEEINVTKKFSMPTEVGVCAGWESIVLPFHCERIIHERGDSLVPFSAWTEQDDSRKPFWLYRANGNGWFATDTIEAGRPYIISMPNNPDYVDGYSLPGKVTFVAKQRMIGPSYSMPMVDEWQAGIDFVGTFMPVEDKDILSLNVNVAAGRDWLGSDFVAEDKTLPFGAYLTANGLPRQIPVFGDWSGVMTPMVAPDYGIVVETPAPGIMRVSSTRECKVSVVTPDGATIRRLTLKGGESVTVDDLTPGLYICAGVKVMVK